MNTVNAVVLAVLITAVISFLVINTFLIKKKEDKYLKMESKTHEMEKQIHLNETKFLEQKNTAEIIHRSEQKILRDSVRKEGYEHGLAEGKKDHLIEITNLKAEHRVNVVEERARAAVEARTSALAEFELQNKLFSVTIKPYVSVEKINGYIWDEYKSETGYQYQLLINGIPAFQPHVVIESSEKLKEVNEEKMKVLLECALGAAKSAAELYMGGSASAGLKMSTPIINRDAKR